MHAANQIGAPSPPNPEAGQIEAGQLSELSRTINSGYLLVFLSVVLKEELTLRRLICELSLSGLAWPALVYNSRDSSWHKMGKKKENVLVSMHQKLRGQVSSF